MKHYPPIVWILKTNTWSVYKYKDPTLKCLFDIIYFLFCVDHYLFLEIINKKKNNVIVLFQNKNQTTLYVSITTVICLGKYMDES